MSDVLSLVRQATRTNATVSYNDKYYTFGNQKLHESTKTCFKRTLKADDYFYTLRDVIFFLENNEIGVGDYRRLCAEKKIAAVVEQDKQSLRSYLLGEIDSCPQIDLSGSNSSLATSAPVDNASSSTNHITESHIINASLPSSAASVTLQSHLAISEKELQEQRQRHAALIDRSIQRPSIISNINELGTSGSSSRIISNTSTMLSGVSLSKRSEEIQTLRRAQKRKLKADGSDDVTASSTGAIDPLFLDADRRILTAIRKDEIPAQTRTTVLCKAGVDFSFALKLFNENVLKPKDAAATSSAGGSTNQNRPHQPLSSTSTSSAQIPDASKQYATPIIIVPASLTGVVSIFNIVELLEKTTYVPIEEKKAQGAKRESVVLVRRVMPSGEVREYKIIDNPSRLTAQEWENRVIAVFASGQSWQFKDWKWSNPVDLFQNALGVHLSMEGRNVEPAVLSWNCKVLKINQFKRHMDAGAVNEFWALVDDFLRYRKPWLIPIPNMSRSSQAQPSGGSKPPSSSSSSSSSSSHHDKSKTSSSKDKHHHSSSSSNDKHRSSSSHVAGASVAVK